MKRLIYHCNHCFEVFDPHGSRPESSQWCDHSDAERIEASRALGLIGFPATGKSVFLATLHDQLMHACPEWHVRVSDFAFQQLTDCYKELRSGLRLSATQPGRPGYFRATVSWQKHTVELLLRDAAGEEYYRLANADEGWTCPGPGWLLRQCPALLVATLCGDDYHPDTDQMLGQFFRKLLKQGNRLRRVVVLRVGVDLLGDSALEADRVALDDFERFFRIFPGVLKNANIDVQAVPVSNFGFGNSELKSAPQPHNVLEPIRRVFPEYLPGGADSSGNRRRSHNELRLTMRSREHR